MDASQIVVPKHAGAVRIPSEAMSVFSDDKTMQADLSRLSKACCSPQKLPALDGAPLPVLRSKGESTPQERDLLSSHGDTMEDNTDKSLYPLLYVHIWAHCSAVFRREQVEGRVHTIGLFICSNCGKEGPLNLDICRSAPPEWMVSNRWALAWLPHREALVERVQQIADLAGLPDERALDFGNGDLTRLQPGAVSSPAPSAGRLWGVGAYRKG